MFTRLTKCRYTNASFQNNAYSHFYYLRRIHERDVLKRKRNLTRTNVSLHSNTTIFSSALNSTVNWSSNKVCVFSQTKFTKNKKNLLENECLPFSSTNYSSCGELLFALLYFLPSYRQQSIYKIKPY